MPRPRPRTPTPPALPRRRNPRPDAEWQRLANEKERLQIDNMRLAAENAELFDLLIEAGIREGKVRGAAGVRE